MDNSIHKNGFTNSQISLLRPYIKRPYKRFTVSDIKILNSKSSHHYVFNALKSFSKRGILKEELIGNTNTYSLTEKSIPYLSQLERLIREQHDLPFANIEKLSARIRKFFFSFIVCGSYAEGSQKPSSDLDIAIIIPDKKKHAYEIALKEGELMVPVVHGFVFTADEFLQMLLEDGPNYGKELVQKHLLIEGAEGYWKIIFEAMKHGFTLPEKGADRDRFSRSAVPGIRKHASQDRA